MQIEDKIFGGAKIREPVLQDLLNSEAVQRLKSVTMGGVVALIGISPPTTRYDHSIGVMLLVRKLGASVPEQVAALLHDVSHTAFSHVVDYAFGCAVGQNYHDEEKSRYVSKTEVPKICASHGINLEWVIDEKNHPLLEQPIPRLCADRADYTLRDLEPLGIATNEQAKQLSRNLICMNGQMAFADVDSAYIFGDAFLACANKSWVNPTHVAFYELCGRALRLAINENSIGIRDIWSSDSRLWLRLKEAGKLNPIIGELIDKMAADTKFLVTKAADADFEVKRKVRWIDPEVVFNGDLLPLSSISKKYADRIEKYRRETSEVIYVRVS